MADPTRTAAFDLLTAVLDRRRPLEEALDALPPLEGRDRSAAHRIAATVLRRLGTLDAVLEPSLRRQPPEPVRIILRIGAAGLLLLDTPSHAAVATAVALARSKGLAPFTGLVNAVLRKVATTGEAALCDLDTARLDTPAWLWTAWGSDARVIAEAHQHEAPLDVTMKAGAAAPAGVPAGILDGAANGAISGASEWASGGAQMLPTGSLRFPPGTAVTAIPGFADGEMWVQDAAAALPARLLAPRPGEAVADLCAAPGGKTAQLAAAGATVTALDRDKRRVTRLSANLDRWGLQATVVTADAITWRPPQPLDAILLDAPCSATGTIRRHPDVAWLKRPRDIQTLNQTQDAMLAAAETMLRPGGRLVYAVCSLQPEEGRPRIAAAVARGGVRLDPFRPEEMPGLPEAITPDGFLRTHPGLWPALGGMDGFFAARLVRT